MIGPVGSRANIYTQVMAEDLVLAANRVAPHRLLTCSLRPAGLFGEGDPQMVPALLDVYYNKKNHFQLGSNDNLFDFTYVGNVAHAHLLAAEALVATSTYKTAPLDHEKVDGEAFMITNGTPICFWDLPRMLWREVGADLPIEKVWAISTDIGIPLAAVVETICKLVGVTTKFTTKGFRMSSTVRYYNIDKARMRLRYEPLWSILEGVKLSVQWDTEERRKKAEKKAQ
jgi:sterol-4alpha-carboxylate 3-dehydrogenase (decarboxylating)